MLRVLYVCEFGTLNGGERSLLAWLPHLRSAGIEPIFLVPCEGPLAEHLRGEGIELRYWGESLDDSSRKQTLSLSQRRADLREIVRTVAPDILHANSLSMSRLSGPVATELRVCSIGHLRDIVRISGRAMQDVNRHRRILAVSQATLDWHVAQGLDRNLACVLYNGVDLEAFAPRPATGYLHEELELPSQARLIGTIGQIGIRKGTDIFISAAATLAMQFDDLYFLVVGERHSTKDEAVEFERQLHRSAGEPPLAGRVRFLGNRDDVSRLLNELSLLVHPARQEPLGRVLLEAAASGTPIAATDVGGTREIVGSQFPLIPPDHAAALFEQARAMLQNEEYCRNLETRLRERMVQQFDARSSATRLMEAYPSAVGRFNSRSTAP